MSKQKIIVKYYEEAQCLMKILLDNDYKNITIELKNNYPLKSLYVVAYNEYGGDKDE
jgi:hypothetical protein